MIIAFMSDCCEPCKEMKPVVDEIDTSLVSEQDTNSDSGKALADQYNVEVTPTLVWVDEKDNEVERLEGSHSAEDVHAMIRRNQ